MANDSRGSRCSETDQLVLYVDGVPMGSPRKDAGCLGDVHIFQAITTLTKPVEYAWYLDSIHNPPVSVKSTYGYTFDDKTHNIYLVVKNTKCGIQFGIEVKGQVCTTCVIKCVQQTAYFPAGEIISLTDINGKVYKIPARLVSECKTPSKTNAIIAKAIARIVRINAGCNAPLLGASLYYNSSTPNCLTLNITNSPIKFQSIKIGSVSYSFQGC